MNLFVKIYRMCDLHNRNALDGVIRCFDLDSISVSSCWHFVELLYGLLV